MPSNFIIDFPIDKNILTQIDELETDNTPLIELRLIIPEGSRRDDETILNENKTQFSELLNKCLDITQKNKNICKFNLFSDEKVHTSWIDEKVYQEKMGQINQQIKINCSLRTPLPIFSQAANFFSLDSVEDDLGTSTPTPSMNE